MRSRFLAALLFLPLAAQAPPGSPRGGGPMFDAVFANGAIRSVTSVTEVFGEGQKLTAVVLDYGRPVAANAPAPSMFAVAGRTVARAYANDRPEKATAGRDGRYVVLELDHGDAEALTYLADGPVHLPASVGVQQLAALAAKDGTVLPPTPKQVTNTRQLNMVVDDFVQRRFTDPATGLILPYNLYVPKGYQPGKRYPLVLFMHDAGVTGPNPVATLAQGNGATVWASPAEQAKHEAFVLAPQFPAMIVDDASEASAYLDVTVELLKSLRGEFAIDPARLYTTGQSGGCMMSIAMNIKHPDLFAASYLVAGQWNPAKVAAIARNKLFIVVSEDDGKAWPGMNAITATLAQHGAKIGRATWDGTWNAGQFNTGVASLLRQGGNIHYAAFRKGTVIPAGESTAGASGHRNTWRIAYTIEGVRDWLFAQNKSN